MFTFEKSLESSHPELVPKLHARGDIGGEHSAYFGIGVLNLNRKGDLNSLKDRKVGNRRSQRNPTVRAIVS